MPGEESNDKDRYAVAVTEELTCLRKEGNDKDRYAVAVTKSGSGVVGHVPRRILLLVLCSYRKVSVFLKLALTYSCS